MKKFLNKITNEIEEADSFTKEFAFSNNSNYEVFEEIYTNDNLEDDNLEDNDLDNSNNIEDDDLDAKNSLENNNNLESSNNLKQDNDLDNSKKVRGKKIKNIQNKTE